MITNTAWGMIGILLWSVEYSYQYDMDTKYLTHCFEDDIADCVEIGRPVNVLTLLTSTGIGGGEYKSVSVSAVDVSGAFGILKCL